MRFWYSAAKDPKKIDDILENMKNWYQKSLKLKKVKWYILISKLNNITFGAVAKKIVIDVNEPSYTSHNQIWKGTAPILKNKVIKTNNKPLNMI